MATMIDIDDVERILWDHHFHDGDGLQALCDVAEILEAVRGHPGAVDIVRCKDCKHAYHDCHIVDRLEYDVCAMYLTDDWFCAYGERRETDADTP